MGSYFESANIIEWGGILLVLLLIFAETGLLLGLIIPGGETLIFTSGLLISTGTLDINVFLFLLLLVVAGFAGDSSGFTIGRKFGSRLYQKEDTWYFKKTYLHMTEGYFIRHETAALILGKFLPVVRPFTPVLAGISKISKIRFAAITLLAVLSYMSTFLLTGFFVGKKFPEVKNYLGWILPVSIVVLLIPVAVQIRKNKRNDVHFK